MTKHGSYIFSCLLALLSTVSAHAQTSRPATSSQGGAKAAASAPALPPNTLAVVNGRPLTLEDLNAEVREAVGSLDRQIAEMRRRALTSQINQLLYEAEAKKRNVPLDQWLNTEVYGRVAVPSDEEVRAIYENNRDQLGSLTLDQARARIISAVREQRSQTLLEELATRLRMMYVVEWGASDVTAPSLAPGVVLATVAGKPITAGDLNEQLRPAINDLRLRLYEAERQAVEAKINERLLDMEAERRRVSRDDLLRVEVSDKVRRPTDADVAKFYEANRSRLGGDLASRRSEIALYLEQEERARLEQALYTRLRGAANVRVMLAEPVGYVQRVSADDDPSRGARNAPVTVVMFTDFQCPACSSTHPVLEEVLKAYGERVMLVVRDFPLDQHQWARKAAEAANAARAQGKYFEYITLLYRNQQALDVASLKKYAAELGLDRARFDAELDSGKYAAEINHDVEDGKSYGVSGTPTIFVNGVRLLDLSDRAMKAAIERAFERAAQKTAVK